MSENHEQNREQERTRAMQPWGSIRARVRLMRKAFSDSPNTVIWAEPIEWMNGRVKNYDVKTVPASEFTGAHPEAIWD